MAGVETCLPSHFEQDLSTLGWKTIWYMLMLWDQIDEGHIGLLLIAFAGVWFFVACRPLGHYLFNSGWNGREAGRWGVG